MQTGELLKNKTIEDLDLDRYVENESVANPYFRKFGPKKKSYFSQVCLPDQVWNLRQWGWVSWHGERSCPGVYRQHHEQQWASWAEIEVRSSAKVYRLSLLTIWTKLRKNRRTMNTTKNLSKREDQLRLTNTLCTHLLEKLKTKSRILSLISHTAWVILTFSV